MHRTKSILAALAGVALSATAVFAAAGVVPADAAKVGLARAAEMSGKAVPVRVETLDKATESPEATRSPKATESPEATERPEAPKTPDVAKTAGSTATHPANHGADVSKAAQGTTPTTFANHGAYVRTVAQKNHGHANAPVAPRVKTHGKSAETHPSN